MAVSLLAAGWGKEFIHTLRLLWEPGQLRCAGWREVVGPPRQRLGREARATMMSQGQPSAEEVSIPGLLESACFFLSCVSACLVPTRLVSSEDQGLLGALTAGFGGLGEASAQNRPGTSVPVLSPFLAGWEVIWTSPTLGSQQAGPAPAPLDLPPSCSSSLDRPHAL